MLTSDYQLQNLMISYKEEKLCKHYSEDKKVDEPAPFANNINNKVKNYVSTNRNSNGLVGCLTEEARLTSRRRWMKNEISLLILFSWEQVSLHEKDESLKHYFEYF